MTEVEFDLLVNRIRPIIYDDYYGINVLIDTGALNNVWVKGENSFKATFNKILDVKEDFEFGGFGGKVTGVLYCVEYNFCNKLYFPKFPVIVQKLDIPADLVLSAAALSGIDYTISDVSKVMRCVLRNNNKERHVAAHDANGEIDFIGLNGLIDDVADTAAAFNELYRNRRS